LAENYPLEGGSNNYRWLAKTKTSQKLPLVTDMIHLAPRGIDGAGPYKKPPVQGGRKPEKTGEVSQSDGVRGIFLYKNPRFKKARTAGEQYFVSGE
jgi:hypothetical protein